MNCNDNSIDNERYAISGDMDRRRRCFEHSSIADLSLITTTARIMNDANTCHCSSHQLISNKYVA
eukprot:scaffold15880_cov113-Skeletonema_dohrnii-CCMP3373.AAC.1